MCVYGHVCMRVYACVYVSVCMCMCVHVSGCMQVYACVCMHVCVHASNMTPRTHTDHTIK